MGGILWWPMESRYWWRSRRLLRLMNEWRLGGDGEMEGHLRSREWELTFAFQSTLSVQDILSHVVVRPPVFSCSFLFISGEPSCFFCACFQRPGCLFLLWDLATFSVASVQTEKPITDCEGLSNPPWRWTVLQNVWETHNCTVFITDLN